MSWGKRYLSLCLEVRITVKSWGKRYPFVLEYASPCSLTDKRYPSVLRYA